MCYINALNCFKQQNDTLSVHYKCNVSFLILDTS